MASDVEAAQVTLKLSTQLPARLRVPANALAVPARLTRYGLSEVVNSLLSLGARRRQRSVTWRARKQRAGAWRIASGRLRRMRLLRLRLRAQTSPLLLTS